ncbi:unnamed protein product [Lymnaea stagnalis]|uniref:Zinc finger CCHC domain-containing protein 7 n=1 Tax=Lymnaea stagnalis TaxID=6523 RepID=A0AAV2IPP7_LYMST
MESGNDSDTDEEYDLQEMEVALYSQIHFDPGPGSKIWSGQSTSPGYRKLILPFKVGVKEIPPQTITSKPLIPQGDFIAFSEENLITSENIIETPNSHCDKIRPINKSHAGLTDSNIHQQNESNFITEDCYYVGSSNVNDSQGTSSQPMPVPVRTEAVGKTSLSCNQSETNVTSKKKSSNTKSELKNKQPPSSKRERGSATSKKKSNQLLPFSITKNKTPKVKTVSEPCLRSDIKDKIKLYAPNAEVLSQKNSKPQLEAFLQLSECNKDIFSSKVKKKVTKIDAAVQLRKPPVLLRRPPAVSVRYKQESDTNTDYSDSDTTSSLCSPIKSTLLKSTSNPSITGKGANTDDAKDEEEEGEVGSTSQEESERNSVGETDSDDNMDFLSETDPNLEFNLAGGVDGLLKNTKSSEKTDWKINEQDRFNMNSLLNRYFSPLKIQCRNCRKDGHMSRDCPMPKKSKCLFCGRDGHVYQVCPLGICFNCSAPGHKVNVCREPKRDWRSRCNRCLMYGHGDQLCPDRWRQFHGTTKPGKLQTQSKGSINTLVFCYNCGKKGHFGYECEAPRMDRFVPATYPLIARYDTKKNRERRETEDSPHVKKSKGIHPKDSHKQKSGKKMDNKFSNKNNSEFQVVKRKNETTVQNHSSPLIFPKSDSRNSDQSRRFQAGKDRSSSTQKGFGNSKSRRRCGQDNLRSGCHEETVDNMMDDYESHQVHANEWWSSRGDKKEQRNKDKTSRRFHHNNDWKTPRSRFPDEASKSSYRNEEVQNINSVRTNKRKGTNSSHDAWSPRKKSTKEENRTYSGDRQYNESSKKFNNKKSQHVSTLHHSSSWPVMAPSRGFQSKNEKFVSMKNEFDISVQLRRW